MSEETKPKIYMTPMFKQYAQDYIASCVADRDRILSKSKDTADDTRLPTIDTLVSDALAMTDNKHPTYYNTYPVTDHYVSFEWFGCNVFRYGDLIIVNSCR